MSVAKEMIARIIRDRGQQVIKDQNVLPSISVDQFRRFFDSILKRSRQQRFLVTVVKHHGQPVGLFIPLYHSDQVQIQDAIERDGVDVPPMFIPKSRRPS